MSELTRADRARAWLVTGPAARGVGFVLEFAAALRTLVRERRGSRPGG